MIAKVITFGVAWMGGITLAQAASGATIEDTLKQVAAQVPALVVLAIVVKAFLASQSEARREYLENLRVITQAHQEQYSVIHKDYLEGRREQSTNVERQIAAMNKQSEAMTALAASISSCPLKKNA